MSTNDSLGDRMKRHEQVSKSVLMRRQPVIIRIDGKAFHTYTKALKKYDMTLEDTPFSTIMHECMVAATKALVENIQGCVLGYTQSDEISLLLRDYDTHETQAWFDYGVQKMASVSASIASAAFNLKFMEVRQPMVLADMAMFDSRVYNLPKEEVVNYFIWRQQDASRNSIQMLGRFHFSAKQMHKKNNTEVQDMLMLEKGINWNDIPTWMKRGSCVLRKEGSGVFRDENIPIFTTDRDYVHQHVMTPDEVSSRKEAAQILLTI